MKQCGKCREVKELSEFRIFHKNSKQFYTSYCNNCNKENSIKNYKKNGDVYNKNKALTREINKILHNNDLKKTMNTLGLQVIIRKPKKLSVNTSNNIEIFCDFCGHKSLKSKSAISRSKKNGYRLFCSVSCYHKSKMIYVREIPIDLELNKARVLTQKLSKKLKNFRDGK